jgi:hypothetical protein
VLSVSSRASSLLASRKRSESLRRYGPRPSTPRSRHAGKAALAAETASFTSSTDASWTSLSIRKGSFYDAVGSVTICDHFLGVGKDNLEGLPVGGLTELC